MTINWFFILCEISIIAYAVVSGVFLTFSDFVMKSLNGGKVAAGVEVMQRINRDVDRTVFMVLLLGMSALSPLLIGYAYLQLTGALSHLIMAGGGLYVVGVFIVSMAFNVPMNQRLDAMEYAGADTAAYWTGRYVPRWTFWNYIRAIASGGSAVCFLIAVVLMAQG